MSGPLGRRPPSDDKHLRKHPLYAAFPTKPVPVVLGFDWHEDFNTPKRVGSRWYIGWEDPDKWGSIRGGHAICARPVDRTDTTGWHTFYDQGQEGACVGFAWSRCMSLLNRKRYVASWLYHEAQKIDEWDDTPPAEGTSVRAGADILRARGHLRTARTAVPTRSEGLSANRWAKWADEVRAALGYPETQKAIPLLNSWGKSWPHVVWLPLESLSYLLATGGECSVPTDF